MCKKNESPDYSNWSKEKQEVFRGLINWWMGMASRKVNSGYKYHYIDMNSARGEGSASLFVDIAGQMNIPYKAYLIEKCFECSVYLENKFEDNDDIRCACGDNLVETPRYIRSLSERFHGMIYNDSFGNPDFDALSECSKIDKCKMLDIIIMISAGAIKRTSHLGYTKLLDGISSINKSYKFIRVPNDQWQWTFSVMSNYSPRNAWPTNGLYRIESDEGQDIIRFLHYSRDEIIDLFGLIEYNRLQRKIKDLQSHMTRFCVKADQLSMF